MTKLLQNKSIIKFLGIALSILLIVALVPQINIAYGSKDDVATDPTAEETTDPSEAEEADEQPLADTKGLEETPEGEAMSIEEELFFDETNSRNDISSEDETLSSDLEIATMSLDEPDAAETMDEVQLANNESPQPINGNVKNANGTLVFNNGDTYTLTVNGNLYSDILVAGGSKLTIEGSGTIIGNGEKGQGSVIIVEGNGSKLTFNGPTVTGGTGSNGVYTKTDSNGKITVDERTYQWGGGICVRRATNFQWGHASYLELKSGTIKGNSAETGGGIYIGTNCGFTMSGGTVEDNIATKHEGGGIYFAGGRNADGSLEKGLITGGNIINNKTYTTQDWGGGGIFVQSSTTLHIDSALVTDNHADGFGGGIAGCPHASIGIGPISNGAAVFQNTADGKAQPDNSALTFLTTATTKKDQTGVVGAGDFLAFGISGGDKTHTLNGTVRTAYEGSYAKGKFDGRANDFYCTLASYISATDLESDEDGIAWRGYMAGVPAGVDIKTENMSAGPVSIAVGSGYAVADATLGLTSTATKDNSGFDRKVKITGNTSTTHGGGVGCNGVLEFGTFTKEEEAENSYCLELEKELVNSISDEILTLNKDEFSFELEEINEPEGENKVYKATNTADGKVVFEGLDGVKTRTEKKFILRETPTDGITSSLGKGAEVDVVLNSTSEKTTIGTVVITKYETSVESIKISGVETNKVTNTLNLKASASIPVTKIAEGIGKGTFTFGLKDVTGDIDDLVDQSSDGTITLKGSNDLGKIVEEALESEKAIEDLDEKTTKTVTIEVGDSTGGKASATDEEAFTFEYAPKAAEEDHWYAIAEQPGTTAGVVYDTTAYLVKITTKVDEGGRSVSTSQTVCKTVPGSTELKNTDETGAAFTDVTFTNVATPKGTWQFQADKFFYGLGEPRDCSFTLQEIERVPEAGEPLANVLVSNDNLQQWTVSVKAGDFEDSRADIVFPEIAYEQQGEGEGFQNDVGDHYYLVTEDGEDAAKDTTAYVVTVTVALDETNSRNLVATETMLRYADDLSSALNPLVLPEGELPAFYNTDTYDLISAASYSVYAASGEPVDQVCYVDPKIIKNLEGRAIKSGEFAFKLIQVENYTDTEGIEISAATNDEFGMVDFDKANNKGTLKNPTCLAYTDPGPYYYRVIEDTSKGGMKDQSVLYSDQVITFTTFIEKDKTTGKLECTKMYYGYWDKAANKNVPFKEQYTDNATQPDDKDAMAKLNPDWHPTITNKARPMDLQVRKTSVTDRDEGLVGATYALYMVNDNVQGDIWLAEATSEEGGWITYKNVSLSTNNLYYFKETAAPAGHTVSEFRSPYFYLVEDATSPNGYALKYSDTKYFDAAEVEAAAIPMAAAEAQAMQADIAAQAEAAATDDQTQPGHSADGNILLTYDKDGGVYDETTQVEVNKLDTRTHEWVEGAKLVILEKESGKEVASWTSGKAPQKLAKTLNVGITYLLREVEAPGEYRLANDVEFVIDNYGNVSITKGMENGNAELSDNTITLYDTMMDAEEVEQRERETTREVPLGTILAQTGDMLPILGIGAIVLASLIALIVAGRRRHEGKDDKN